MNISGIRPKQEFYAGVERREPEKKEIHRLNQVAIRMVEMPPLFSEEPMNGPAAAVKVMADTFRDYDREVVAVVNLRADMRPININIASIGALDQSIAHPREILKSTILSNAAAIILVHNHPSGRLVPSVEDIGLTDRMNKICDLIGVKLVDHIIVGPGNEFYSFQEKNQMPLASLKLTKNLEDIELEGFRVAENTAVKEEKKVITLTVAECMEFHSMGEFHENIKSVAEAVAKFKAIPPERMHGVPAIGIRAADPKDPDEYTEMDVLIGRRFDMDMLRYIPEIADNWQAQQMIASLIHEMPDVKVVGQIPDSIQKKIDWLESRDKRTDELQQITDKLEKGVMEVFQSDRYKQFLDTMAKFPRYSVNNSLLIMIQKPDAQLCQSFTGWKQMGRYVKKGEKGISILAPAPYKIEREQTKLDEKGRPVFDADGEPVKEKVEVTIRAFKVVKTFDLSQTDGKELPTIGPSELVGNIEGYPKLLQALQEISPVPVSFELIDGDAKGFYHLEDKKIVLGVANAWNARKGLPDLLTLAGRLGSDYQVVLIGLIEKQLPDIPSDVLGLLRTVNQTELAQWYSAADVFVNPTYEETFGLTTVEAQACGTPVVVYETDGCPETVAPGNGRLVSQGDMQALENAVRDVADSNWRAEPKKMERFDKDTVYQGYVELYENVLSTLGKGRVIAT